ncbi:MAG: pyridoxamine 5'-phosphate oxidase family protein [Alphaproteobacteria bacterium]
MSDIGHTYVPPQSVTSKTIPDQIVRYFDGKDLLQKTQAIRLSTVDAAGWPHASLLSAGDVLAMSPERLRFAVFAQSTTTANLLRDGRVTATLSIDRGMCEVRMRARCLTKATSDISLAMFEATVEQVRMHIAPYADVTTGITFQLHKPGEVLRRWESQIDALRKVR